MSAEQRHEEIVKLMKINNKLLQVVAITAIANSQADTKENRLSMIDQVTQLTDEQE